MALFRSADSRVLGLITYLAQRNLSKSGKESHCNGANVGLCNLLPGLLEWRFSSLDLVDFLLNVLGGGILEHGLLFQSEWILCVPGIKNDRCWSVSKGYLKALLRARAPEALLCRSNEHPTPSEDNCSWREHYSLVEQ